MSVTKQRLMEQLRAAVSRGTARVLVQVDDGDVVAWYEINHAATVQAKGKNTIVIVAGPLDSTAANTGLTPARFHYLRGYNERRQAGQPGPGAYPGVQEWQDSREVADQMTRDIMDMILAGDYTGEADLESKIRELARERVVPAIIIREPAQQAGTDRA